jgi:hypothetical protein
MTYGGLVTLGGLPWPASAELVQGRPEDGSSLLFTTYRNGDRLGFHRLEFSRAEERLIVDIEIVFDVKLAFIPLYRYRHRNREIWEAGRLASLNSETDDNGDRFWVKARAGGERLLVDSNSGKLDLPGDTLTTSYWNEAAVTKGEWLDTQKGQLARSTVVQRPVEPAEALGETVEANRYDLEGDITCSLWYADNRWVKLFFLGEDGSEIVYALETPRQNG